MDLDQTQTPSTTAGNDLSFGPALIGTSSLDSPATVNTNNYGNATQSTGDISQTVIDDLVDMSGESNIALEPRISHLNDMVNTQDESSELINLSTSMTSSISGVGASGDQPLQNQQGSVLTDDREVVDMPTLQEAREYANDLARELINDTNQIVSEEHSDLLNMASGVFHETVESAITSTALKQEADEAVDGTGSTVTCGKIVSDAPVKEEDNEAEPILKQVSFGIGEAKIYFDQDSLDMRQEEEDDDDDEEDKDEEEGGGGGGEGEGEVEGEERKNDAELIEGKTMEDEDPDKVAATSDTLVAETVATSGTDYSIDARENEDSPDEGQEEIASEIAEVGVPDEHSIVGAERKASEPSTGLEFNQKHNDNMEFTKNYSDDLLMSSASEHKHQDQQNQASEAQDLADFELPQFSGSSGSSGSEQTPASTSAITNENLASSSSSTSTDLTAIKNILISSYSKFSHVFHWKKPIESGIIFCIGLTFITALTFFSIISVVAYSALGIILASSSIRMHKATMKTLNKSPETPVDHIWNKALSINVGMSPEKMHKLVDATHGNLNNSLVYFKQVLLVEDKFATLKFALFLYMLTYIGAWFNGLTLITITYMSLFSLPLFYEKNKTKIDDHLNILMGHISSTISSVTIRASALVFGSQSPKSTKKQD